MTEMKGSFGQQMVGVSFNPSKQFNVDETKQTFADLIDLVSEEDAGSVVKAEIQGHVILKLTEACMWTVKFLTANQ